MVQSTTKAKVKDMDYEAIAKQAEENSKFWKVPEGETVVVPLAEIGEEYDTEMNGKKVKCRDLLIEIKPKNIQKVWSLKVGGAKSNFRRVVDIARKHKTLIGVSLRVTRQGTEMNDTTYTIIDISQPAQ